MKSLNYKLIVSDFDGTLIDNNQQISPEVREAINEYISCGGIFAVCTGRMLRSILPRVRELGLKGLVIAFQGTVIADIESGKLIKNGGMSLNNALAVCRYLEELKRQYNVYSGENIFTDMEKENKHLKLYESIVGVDATSIKGKLSDFVLNNNLFCQKISFFTHKEEQELLYKKVRDKFLNKLDVTCSASVLVEVSPIEDNKGEALKFLAEHYGVPIEKTVAVGDNLNDLSMIKQAGIGVAVGNAVKLLKDEADFVSVTNNEGAIAQIIEKYGFA